MALSFDFLDDGGEEGANQFAGTPLLASTADDCGWVFGGYAIPLLDPPENHARVTALGPTCETDWTPYLNYHVRTTSTCTVYTRDREQWRIYMQDARLEPDGAEAYEDSTTAEYPSTHPVSTAQRFPSEDDEGFPWSGSGRFSGDYISFVTSADGGLTFPVYAPTINVHRFSQSRPSGTLCPEELYNSAYSSGDFTNAGWTPTCVPCTNSGADATADSDGTWSVYRDVSVIDLFDRWGIYLMIAIECRTTEPVTTGGCGSCVPCESTDCDLPFTRLVLIASTSPDFPTDDPTNTTVGPFTWPDPRLHSEAMVLLQPDLGAGGPAAGVGANEWYGVPTALLVEGGERVLVYAPWVNQGGSCTTTLPGRVDARYGGMPTWQGGATASRGFGVSVFTPYSGELALLAWWIVYADRNGGSWGGRTVEALRAELLATFGGAYQGELLVTDGDEHDRYAGAPSYVMNVDPAAVMCGTCPEELWIYWADVGTAVDADGVTHSDLSQVRRAFNVSKTALPTAFQPAVGANGDYTLFLTLDRCSTVLDVRSLFVEDPESYVLVAPILNDPDIAVLPSGRLRCSFFSDPQATIDTTGAAIPRQYGAGLVCAWAPPSACQQNQVLRSYPPFAPTPGGPELKGPDLDPPIAVPMPQLASLDALYAFLAGLEPGRAPLDVKGSRRRSATPPEPPDPNAAVLAAVQRLTGDNHARALDARARLMARCA